MTGTQVNSLDDFQGWDQGGNEEDFFKELDSTTTAGNSFEEEDVVSEEEEEEEEVEEIQQPDTSKKTKEEDTDMFEEFSEEEEEEEEDDEDQKKPSTLKSIETLKFLKERGLADYELEEGEELTEEFADEILEDSFSEAVNGRVQDLFEDLPDVVKQLNSYVLKGGNPNEFLKSLTKHTSSGISDDMDLNDETDQELVVREMMRVDGDDDEIIDSQLEFLKDSGKLKLFADRNFSKWKKKQKETQDALVARQDNMQKQIKENVRESKRRMSQFLAEEKNLGGMTLSKEDSKSLPNYVNDRTVKLQNGSFISELQKELYYDLPQNETAYLQLATLMKNRNEDGTFNFDSIMEAAKTSVSRKVRDDVRRTKKSIPTNSKNRTFKNSNKSLADFFNK